jgi:hypothetical protein
MSTENDDKQDVLPVYTEEIEKSMGSNPDIQSLGTMPCGRFTVGYVDAISGEDVIEGPTFLVTQYELKQLVLHWMTERLEMDFDYFLHQTGSGSGWRWSKYTTRRLDRLQDILGQESMDALWEEASTAFRKRAKLTDEDWRIFRTGSEQEQDDWRDENETV